MLILSLLANLVLGVVLLVDGLRPRGPCPPGPGVAGTLAALCLALACTGCGVSALDAAKVAIGSASAFYNEATPRLVAEYAAAEQACTSRGYAPSAAAACVDAVRVQWAPVKSATTAAFLALTAAEGALHLAEAGAALGQTPDLSTMASALSTALDAADRMRRAIAALGGPATPHASAPVVPVAPAPAEPAPKPTAPPVVLPASPPPFALGGVS